MSRPPPTPPFNDQFYDRKTPITVAEFTLKGGVGGRRKGDGKSILHVFIFDSLHGFASKKQLQKKQLSENGSACGLRIELARSQKIVQNVSTVFGPAITDLQQITAGSQNRGHFFDQKPWTLFGDFFCTCCPLKAVHFSESCFFFVVFYLSTILGPSDESILRS